MTEAKPSGIRPPSKIGRPCCTLPPRAAVPPASPGNSMDHLWETHGRKLSEAGLRRGSDTSVVLTEDTDSFIIGDRVWVGGTKPGSIAYIGETQFAPGDWAGVVLDEPIGKNDGSVAGCRYFQCEPKRGIFSRLTRLTRQPLPEASSPIQRTPTTPPDSTRGGCSIKSISPSLNTSTTSLSSTVSQRDLKIGERVIVSSSQGSKTGVLRYMGGTEFAPGEWCGVELDDPLGKNDGSVGDKRYFECRPKYGLFAPAHKVSRSPTSKRTSCVIHKPSGAALNSTLKRTNSRESLVSISSVNSSIAGSRIATGATRRPGMRTSTPIQSSLQEMLKEKQQEIEFLRRERDLERDRVTKAANQADQAEQSVILIKQEYDKYREETQKTVLNAETAFKKLLEERNTLAMQLEEERRKCEDLLFRFEEESVNKDDIQKERSDQSVINTVNENRIKALEKQLSEERERVVQLERDSTKLFEAEEELARLRSNANNQDKKEFEDLRNLNESLRETKDVLEKQIGEKTSLIEEYLATMKGLEMKLKDMERECTSKEATESDLRRKLELTTEDLREKSISIDKMRQEFDENTSSLRLELNETRKTIEEINDRHAIEKRSLITEYEKIIEDKNGQIEMKSQQLATESQKRLESQSELLENLKADNMKRIGELSESFDQQLNVKEAKLKEMASRLNEKITEARKLEDELSNQKDLYARKDGELNDAFFKLEELSARLKAAEDKNVSLADQLRTRDKDVAEDTKKIIMEKEKLEEDVSSLRATVTDVSANLEKLTEELRTKDKELKETRATTNLEIEELKRRYKEQIEEKSKCIEEIGLDTSKKSMTIDKLEKDILELRSIVVSKDDEIKHLLEKNSELQYALTLSEQTKTNLESELRVFESNIDNLNQRLARSEEKLANVTAQRDKLELDLANSISSTANSSEQLTRYTDELREREREIDKLRDSLYQAENRLSGVQGKLESVERENERNMSSLAELRSVAEETKIQLTREREECVELTRRITEERESKERDLLGLKETIRITEETLNEKRETIVTLNERLRTIEEENAILRERCDTSEVSFASETSILKEQLDDLKGRLTRSLEETKSLQKAKAKLEADQSANRWSIEELTEKLTAETEARSRIESSISEKDSRIKSLNEVIDDLRRDMDIATRSKEETLRNDFADTLNTMERTVADLNNKLILATENIETKCNELAIERAETERRVARISELTDELDRLKSSHALVNDKLKGFEDSLRERDEELRMALDNNASLLNDLKRLEMETVELRSEIVVKNNLLAESNETIKDIRDAKEDRIIRLKDKLEGEVREREAALDVSKKRNDDLEKEKESLERIVEKQSVDLRENVITVTNLMEQLKTLRDGKELMMKDLENSKNEEVRVLLNEMEEMRKRQHDLSVTKDSLEKSIKERDGKIDMLTNTIKSKEKEAEKNTQNLIEKLNIVTAEAAQLKEVQSRLEKENKQITSKLSEATNQLKLSRENIKNNFDAAGGDVNQQMDKDIDVIRLKEENETVKGQIDFLNSVIVDMQRKNETLLCKIEVLEMGVPANEADEYNRSTLEKRNKAPRMFCDICDQFDLHETEDCPRQAQDFSETEKIIKSPKKQSLERPYCENCETFGHDTRDCDDTETY